ncbi:MAG: hypothetical protein DMG49_26080 [Acidobacteria bacterium]|nr:MAG: hypothetical protein DMG49_26080 [Acidobacteriota bacterium]
MKLDFSGARNIATLFLCLALTSCGGGTSHDPSTSPSSSLTITTAGVVGVVVGVPFSLTLQATGWVGSLTWSVFSGILPTGLDLNASTGVISGTPGVGSDEVVIFQVSDSRSSVKASMTFRNFAPLTLKPVTLAKAHLNAPYSLLMIAQGQMPVSWTISAGQLPPGLRLVASSTNAFDANISGTPTQTGSFQFTVEVKDNTVPQTAALNLGIAVDDNLAITKSNLQHGVANQSYSDSFTAVNGSPPYQWSVPGLPAGLALNTSTGQVSGTPIVTGTFNYSVSVKDSSSPQQSDTQPGSINLLLQLQIVGTLQNAILKQAYYQPLQAIGGQPPYIWSIVSGKLPPGIVQIGMGGQTLNGVATQLGTYNFVLQVNDSSSPNYVASESVTLQVKPVPLQITGRDAPPAPLGLLYHFQVPLFGGTPPFIWNLVPGQGQLPPGLALDSSNGYIDGVPTQLGSFPATIQATDSGSPPQTSSRSYTMLVRKALGRNDSIATATPLGNGYWPASISPYIAPITGSTANPDSDYYRVTGTGGSVVHIQVRGQSYYGNNPLDPVLEILDSNGQRLATCTTPAYNSPCLNDDIDATTTDSALDLQVPGAGSTQTTFYAHVFDERGDARPDMVYQIQISGAVDPLKISPTSLGAGATRGVNYQQQFSTTGGTGNVTWSVGSGILPPGWVLGSGGLLNGVATTNGTYAFTIIATDSASPPDTATTQYTLLIADPLVITSPAMWPIACLGQAYSFTVQTTGGVPPFNWGFYSASWPAGINFPISPPPQGPTLVFSGVGNVLGTFTARVSPGDSAQPSSGMIQVITLTIANCP